MKTTRIFLPANAASNRPVTRLLAGRFVASACLLLMSLACASPALAQYATGGSGIYRQNILWFDWGAAPDNIPQSGVTVTNNTTVAGQTLSVTCTVNNISGGGADPDLRIYRPGSYYGDGLDNLYNRGGVGTANTMDIGLVNRNLGATVSFTFSCSATLGGNPYPIQGLVFADAEATNINESIRANLPTGATMRVVERYRAAGCSTGYNVNVSGTTYTFSTLSPYNCDTSGTGEQRTAPISVNFLDGATSANLTLAPVGNEAMALGVMLNVADYGDAPGSYGSPAHLPQYTWSGGVLPQGNTNIFGAFTLATQVQPVTALLGSRVDVEEPAWAGAGATLDDTNGGSDDEDGVNTAALAPLRRGLVGGPYSVPVTCVGTAPVAGWIDFDRNGVFDSDERSATATCSSGTATLTWTVNADIAVGQSYLRVRTATNVAQVANATGIASDGETEDYALSIQPSLRLAKTWSGAAVNDTASLRGTIGGTTVVSLSSTADTASETDTGSYVAVTAGNTIALSETLGAGNTGAYNASAWSCAGTSGLSGSTLTVGASDSEITCTLTNTRRSADVAVVKTVSQNPALSGQDVTYTIRVTNTGPDAATNVVVTDEPGTGLSCPAATALNATCAATGSAQCPGGGSSATVPAADLLGSGVTLPNLPGNGTDAVTLTMTCTVTASGQ